MSEDVYGLIREVRRKMPEDWRERLTEKELGHLKEYELNDDMGIRMLMEQVVSEYRSGNIFCETCLGIARKLGLIE